LDLPILETPIKVVNGMQDTVMNPYITDKEPEAHESEDEDVKVIFSQRPIEN